ncbi:bactofilin family protein [Halorussus caseinilyticus]|uniref:Polymer-forming cytoskeletal protein n=1 Tax=Halorussus caseinilyticus TaxID=3034025 RepID=A0ABD5WSE0_9EURY
MNGNLDAFGGNVFVNGRVNGDLNAVAGNVRINGTVTGDASAVGGNVLLAQGARVGGQLETGAGNVVLNGEVGEDVRVGAESVTLGSSAVVGGDFVYDGNLDRAEGSRIDGEVRQDSDLGVNVGFDGPLVPNWVGWVYGFLVNLVLGAVVLLLLPRFSETVAERATGSPLRAGGVGLALFVGIPILAALFFVSLVGIPLGLLVILLYPLALWFGYVYGAFALGRWALGLADSDNRWAALVVGLLAVSVVGFVPILGGLVQFFVLLFGLGAFALGLWGRYQRRRERRSDSDAETTM